VVWNVNRVSLIEGEVRELSADMSARNPCQQSDTGYQQQLINKQSFRRTYYETQYNY
jgi:hypothetical protein